MASRPSTSVSSSATHSAQSSESGPSSRNKQDLIVLIPRNIDVEEEAELYAGIVNSASSTLDQDDCRYDRPGSPPSLPHDAQSVFSNDIWLGDNSGGSNAFARDVQLAGWTSVGDKRGGAYVVYDCVIKTKEGAVIHALKRYSAFAQLDVRLRATLPSTELPSIPTLPPKSPLAKLRPTFLDRRRRLLQHWLTAILLNPDIGGCQAVREWVMDKS